MWFRWSLDAERWVVDEYLEDDDSSTEDLHLLVSVGVAGES